MVEHGYAAVTTRRVSNLAGVNNGLVHYYFGTMDDLFIELFRRRSERSLERLRRVLDDPQPLWALWEQSHDLSNNAIVMEFIALANHRKAIKKEISVYSRKHRDLQLERLSGVLERYGVDAERWPTASLLLLMTGTARLASPRAELRRRRRSRRRPSPSSSARFAPSRATACSAICLTGPGRR